MNLLLGWPHAAEVQLDPWIMQQMKVDRAEDGSVFLRMLPDGYNRIAVHAGLFPTTYPWEWLQAIRRTNADAEVVVVLSEKVHGSIYMELISDLAAGLGFRIIPAGLAESEAAQRLRSFLHREGEEPEHSARGRLIAIHSGSPRDGGTTIAVHTAIGVAERTGLRVGLLDLNLKSPGLRSALDIPGRRKSIADLRPGCLSGSLSESELLAACVKPAASMKLQVLLGSARRDIAGDYEPEQLKTLLETARRTFDLVIADVHTFPDNAATVYSVRSADERWVVAQPQIAGFRSSWSDWFNCVWRYCGLTAGDFALIVNREETGEGLTATALAAAAGIPLLATVANVPAGAGIKAANSGVLLSAQAGADRFRCDMDGLVRRAAEGHGVSLPLPGANRRRGVVRKVMSSVFSNLI